MIKLLVKVSNNHTLGICEYSNGDRYEGGLENTKKSGKVCIKHELGVLHYKNGERLECVWEDDKPLGNGINDLRIGKFYFSNGDEYEGEMDNGIMNGKGNVISIHTSTYIC